MIKEAMLWAPLKGGKVACALCSHRCVIAPAKSGICAVRENQGGKLVTLVYGEVIAAHVDPIEKKPLYHFHPGSKALSIAAAGCNFRCSFCQNWEISQAPRREGGALRGEKLSPEEIVREAGAQDCRSISYTYTEPTIFFEYAYDTARLAKESGLANNFVTNGYMTGEALAAIRPYLDAANVDLKAFKDETYRRVCGARLEPVLETIRGMKELGIWVEVTTLVVPGMNDGEEEERRRRLERAMKLQHAEAPSAVALDTPPEPGPQSAPGPELSAAPYVRGDRKVGRNEPCPCGSGKKFKHCHGTLT